MSATLGVVVAGGRGTRLGRGVPKAGVEVAGRDLLQRALDILEPLADRVVVAAPRVLELRLGAASRVHDAPGAAGPLAGMVAGLRAHPHRVAWVLGVDFPLVRPATLSALRARLERSGAVAVLPCPGGVPQPLVCALTSGAATHLDAALARGERSPTRALQALDIVRLDDAALAALGALPDEFLNVNTPADLAAAERALVARARDVA